jgi:hypothetical protein
MGDRSEIGPAGGRRRKENYYPKKGKKPSELTLAEMDAVWDEVNPFDSPVLPALPALPRAVARPGPGFPVPVLARPGPGDAQG